MVLLLAGCSRIATNKKLAYLGDEPTRYYRDQATRIDEPVVATVGHETLVPVAPRRLRSPRRDEVKDLSLEEAVHTALANATILRRDQEFLAQGGVVTAGDTAPSVFDPALQQSEFGFSNRGVEAALSDFDTQFTTQMLWGRRERVQNSLVLSGGLPPGSVLTEDTGDFTSRLEKRFGNGGTFGVQHDWNYSLSNRPGLLFGSSYTGFLQADYRHPLWAGRGVEFTRVAGPTTGDGQIIIDRGVAISRINEDVALADFELNVRNLLRDVEELYWNLALAYHVYDSEVSARNNALRTWRIVEARLKSKLASAGEEAQARDAYYDARARTENALADLYEAETRLRRLLGLHVNDGFVLRPGDPPLTAEIELDWDTSHAVALTRRVELRRQKWRIKSLELQLRAARNLDNPRLDFVSSYQRNAFGDKLFAGSDDDGFTAQGFRNAYETLSQGGQDSWTVGVEFSVPLGQRAAKTRVRNVELRLAKARSALAAAELEVGHEVAIAFQRIDRALVTAKSNYSRYLAARKREAAFTEEYRSRRISVDELLRAQTSVAQAKAAYYQSIVQYNQAIAELHHRTGTLLEENHVHLAEAPWEPAAYEFAVRRAEARSHATPAGWLLHAEPEPFAAPPLAEVAPAWVDGGPEHSIEPPPGESIPIPEPGPVLPPPVEETQPETRVELPPIPGLRGLFDPPAEEAFTRSVDETHDAPPATVRLRDVAPVEPASAERVEDAVRTIGVERIDSPVKSPRVIHAPVGVRPGSNEPPGW